MPRKAKPRRGAPRKVSPARLVQLLNTMAEVMTVTKAAVACGVHVTTIYEWVAKSNRGDPDFEVTWLGKKQQFAQHMLACRELSKISLDQNTRSTAIHGWEEPIWHDGAPVWITDEKVAADAISMSEDEWFIHYTGRDRADIFLRKDGKLVQATKRHPPNAQLLVRVLSSLMPGVYSDKATVEHIHTGHVLLEGGAPQQIEAQPTSITDQFGISQPISQRPKATNVLALPTPCKSSEDFDMRFMRKLLREAQIFRDIDGTIEKPLDDDVIVTGSWQHREYTKAGLTVQTRDAADLIEEGWANDFLFKLVPADLYEQKKPTKADIYEVKETDSALVADMKRRAAAGVQNPFPRDARGNRTVPKTGGGGGNDPPEKITGTSADADRPLPVGNGAERIGAGKVAPGGYNALNPGRGNIR